MTHKVQGNPGTRFSRFLGCRVRTGTSSETPTKCTLPDPYKSQSVQHHWTSEKPKNDANEHKLDVARVPGRCVRWAVAHPGCKSCRAFLGLGCGQQRQMNEKWSNRPHSRSSVHVDSATRAIGRRDPGVIHRLAARESQ